MNKPVILNCQNLSKSFSSFRAVNDISLSVTRGEVVGFVGPNGAGKTTTIGLLLGHLAASEGQINLFDSPISPGHAAGVMRRIGFIAGDMSLFDNLRGDQYLRFMARRYGVAPQLQGRLFERIQPQLNKRIKSLSRGNRQKIALMAALQHDPDLLVMDEPTTGLDPLMQDTFLDIIRQRAAAGTTVFMSSHMLSEVADVCSRVIFMKQGKIVVDQPIGRVVRDGTKRIHLTASAAVIAKLTFPSGLTINRHSKTRLIADYTGDINLLLKWLATHSLRDVTVADQSLDDIFLHLYDDERTGDTPS